MGDDLNDGKWHNFVLDQRGSAVTIRLDNRKQSHGMTTGGTGEVTRGGLGWLDRGNGAIGPTLTTLPLNLTRPNLFYQLIR